jgi:hypothetical protein
LSSITSPYPSPDPNHSDEKEHHKLVPNHHSMATFFLYMTQISAKSSQHCYKTLLIIFIDTSTFVFVQIFTRILKQQPSYTKVPTKLRCWLADHTTHDLLTKYFKKSR